MTPLLAPAPPTDDLARAAAGDRAAFGRLLERYQAAVCAVAFATTGDRASSEDIAQETFVVAWRKLRGLPRDASIGAWLCGIARNLARNERRRRARAAPPVAPDAAVDPRAPDVELEERERDAEVQLALARLPPGQREVLVLYYREGRSVDEVAARLGLSAVAVKQRLSRGRRELRGALDGVVALAERTRPAAAFAALVVAAIAGIDQAAAAPVARGVAASKLAVGALAVAVLCGVAWLARSASSAAAARAAAAPASPRSPLDAPASIEAVAPRPVAAPSASAVGPYSIEGQVLDADGAPIEGARVIAIGHDGLAALTAADGSSELRGLRAEAYSLIVRRGDHVAGPEWVRPADSDDPVLFWLGRGGGVRVTVRDLMSGAPIERARVLVQRDDAVELTTGADGAAVARGLRPGTLEVRASAEGRALASGQVPVVAGSLEEVTLWLPPARALTGVVLGPDAAGIAGAEITAYRLEPELTGNLDLPPEGVELAGETRAAVDGSFALALGPGRHRLVVTDGVHAPLIEEIEDASAPVELTLPAGREVRGQVTADGAPAADAVVWVELSAMDEHGRRALPGRQVVSDRDGRFAITGLPAGSVQVTARGARTLSETRDVDLAARSIDDLALALSPTGTIEGVLVDPDGAPLAEATVEGRGISGAGPYAGGPVIAARSDGEGRFTLHGVGPGPHRLMARRRGPRAEEMLFAGTVEAAAGDRGVRVALLGTGALIGRVIDHDGRPVTRFSVAIDGILRSFTAADGRFRYDGVPDGGHGARILLPGRHPWSDGATVRISAGEDTDLGTRRATAGVRVRGRVVRPGGAPVVGAVVRVRPGTLDMPRYLVFGKRPSSPACARRPTARSRSR